MPAGKATAGGGRRFFARHAPPKTEYPAGKLLYICPEGGGLFCFREGSVPASFRMKPRLFRVDAPAHLSARRRIGAESFVPAWSGG